MQPPPNDKEDHSAADFGLAQMSTLFDSARPGVASTLSLPETAAYSSGTSGTSTHGRSISLESAASLIQGAQALSTMSRTHPSLPGYPAGLGSPDISHEPSSSSSTSSAQRRERYAKLPSARRRSHTLHSEDDESEDLEPLDPDATEEEKKLHKRKQNTLAARRSRAKKAMETQTLREEVSKLRTENAIWKERALMMERLLITHGLPCPNFSR